MTLLAAAVELEPVVQASAVALLGGVAVPVAFAFGLRALIAAGESRRARRHLASVVTGAFGVLALTAAAAAAIAGIVLMVSA